MTTLADIRKLRWSDKKPDHVTLTRDEAITILREAHPEMTEPDREEALAKHREWQIFGFPVVLE